jgi:hypothetical protein
VSIRSWSPIVILASSALAMLEGVAASGTSTPRTLVVVWFFVMCPGLGIVGLLRLRDPWLELALVPAVSLAVDVIVGAVLSYAGLWSLAAGVVILVAISVAGALGQDLLAFGPGTRRRAR